MPCGTVQLNMFGGLGCYWLTRRLPRTVAEPPPNAHPKPAARLRRQQILLTHAFASFGLLSIWERSVNELVRLGFTSHSAACQAFPTAKFIDQCCGQDPR